MNGRRVQAPLDVEKRVDDLLRRCREVESMDFSRGRSGGVGIVAFNAALNTFCELGCAGAPLPPAANAALSAAAALQSPGLLQWGYILHLWTVLSIQLARFFPSDTAGRVARVLRGVCSGASAKAARPCVVYVRDNAQRLWGHVPPQLVRDRCSR